MFKSVSPAIIVLTISLVTCLIAKSQNLLKNFNTTFNEEVFIGEINKDGSLMLVGNKSNTQDTKTLTIFYVNEKDPELKFSLTLNDTSLYPTQIYLSDHQINVWGLGKHYLNNRKDFVFNLTLDSEFRIINLNIFSSNAIRAIETLKVKSYNNKTYAFLTIDSSENSFLNPVAILAILNDSLEIIKHVTTSAGIGYGRDFNVDQNCIKLFIHDGTSSNIVTLNHSYEITKRDSLVFLDNFLTSPILSFSNYLPLPNGHYLLSGRSDSLMVSRNYKTTQRISITVFDTFNNPIKRFGFGDDTFEDGLLNNTMNATLAFYDNLIKDTLRNEFLIASNWVDRYSYWYSQSNQGVIICLDSTLNEKWRTRLQIPNKALFLYSVLRTNKGVYVIGNTSPSGVNPYQWDMFLIKLDNNGFIYNSEQEIRSAYQPVKFENPVNRNIILNCPGLNITSITVQTVSGKTINIFYQIFNDYLYLETENLKEGLYFLNITLANGELHTTKFLKSPNY